MPYQEPGTCRFYIHILEWLRTTIGYPSVGNKHFTLPVTPSGFGQYGYGLPTQLTTTDAMGDGNSNFIAVLGHNLISNEENQGHYLSLSDTGNMVSIVNGFEGTSSDYTGVSCDGFSISTYQGKPTYIQLPPDSRIGSIIIGTFYDMPHSADLKISMERQMDGVQKVRTRGGNDLVDYRYHKPAMWGSLGAWELMNPVNATDQDLQPLSRSGRRIWNLSFSYLQDSDVFPVSSSVNWEGVYPDSASNHNLLLQDDTFYGQVIHKTNGGQLPFIFQPDVNDNTNFAIAKFMNSFQFSQVANGVYNVKLKIKEVW